jgi:hypothetical protein
MTIRMKSMFFFLFLALTINSIPSVFAVTIHVRGFPQRPTEEQIIYLLENNRVTGFLGTYQDQVFRGMHSEGAHAVLAVSPSGRISTRANGHVSVPSAYSAPRCLSCRIDPIHGPRNFVVTDVPHNFFFPKASHYFFFLARASEFPPFNSFYEDDYNIAIIYRHNLNSEPRRDLRSRDNNTPYYQFEWPGANPGILGILVMPEFSEQEVRDSMVNFPPAIIDTDFDFDFNRDMSPSRRPSSRRPHDRDYISIDPLLSG